MEEEADEYVELYVSSTTWRRIEGIASLADPPMTGKQYVYDLLDVVARRGVAVMAELANVELREGDGAIVEGE